MLALAGWPVDPRQVPTNPYTSTTTIAANEMQVIVAPPKLRSQYRES